MSVLSLFRYCKCVLTYTSYITKINFFCILTEGIDTRLSFFAANFLSQCMFTRTIMLFMYVCFEKYRNI